MQAAEAVGDPIMALIKMIPLLFCMQNMLCQQYKHFKFSKLEWTILDSRVCCLVNFWSFVVIRTVFEVYIVFEAQFGNAS